MQAGLRAPLPDGGRKANPHAEAREAAREYVRGPTCDRSKAAGKKQQRTAASKPRGREKRERLEHGQCRRVFTHSYALTAQSFLPCWIYSAYPPTQAAHPSSRSFLLQHLIRDYPRPRLLGRRRNREGNVDVAKVVVAKVVVANVVICSGPTCPSLLISYDTSTHFNT